MRARRPTRPVALALLVAVSGAGCGGGAGGLGDILGGVLGGPQPASGNVGQLVAEVQFVDTRSREIDVVTDDGQRGEVAYDDRTRVVYRQEEYPVSALERGDVVEMRLQEVRDGYYTDQILVRQSVQERQGTFDGERTVEASGTVAGIDHQRGWFDLDTYQGTVTATLPYNPPSHVVRVFERLRRGDRVTVEGYRIASDRIEVTAIR